MTLKFSKILFSLTFSVGFAFTSGCIGEEPAEPDVSEPSVTPDDDAGTPPGNDDGGTPPGNDDGGTPPGNDDGGTPPGNDDAGTPPGNDDAGTPPGNDDGGTPPGNTDGGTPPGNTDGGTPPGNTDGGTPPGNTDGGTPPGNTDGGNPPGNDDGGTPPGNTDGGVNVHQAEIDSFLQAYSAYFDCTFSELGFYAQLDDQYGLSFTFADFEGYIRGLFENPNLEVDYDALVLCQADIEALAATCDFSGPTSGCDGVFTGLVPNGEACADLECATGYCEIDASGCGLCVPYAQLDESCVDLDCAGDLVCDALDVCSPIAAEGDSCEFVECDEGLNCGVDSICAQPLQLGGLCDVAECADGLACDYSLAEPSCVDAPTDGELCINDVCAADLECDFTLVDPVCGPAIGEGSACSVTLENPVPCGSVVYEGLSCINGTCQVPAIVEVGETCDFEDYSDGDASALCHNMLSSTYCDFTNGLNAGVCTYRPAIGDSCLDAPCNLGEATCILDVCEALPVEGESCAIQSCATGNSCENDICVARAVGPPICQE